jgi:hypothetical protein
LNLETGMDGNANCAERKPEWECKAGMKREKRKNREQNCIEKTRETDFLLLENLAIRVRLRVILSSF